jgi:hypothetical protein
MREARATIWLELLAETQFGKQVWQKLLFIE